MRWTITAALLCVLALAPGARAADPVATSYPDANGWTFDANQEAFKDTLADCGALGMSGFPDPTGIICATTNTYDKDNGAPKGSLNSDFYTLQNQLGVFAAVATWSSPAFKLAADKPVGNATILVDRKAFVSPDVLVNSASIRADVVLVDETDKNARSLLIRDELGINDIDFWVRRTRSIGAEGITPGHTYHLDLTAVITTDSAQVLDSDIGVGWDNLRLVTTEPVKGDPGQNGTSGSAGPAGPEGSQGPAGPPGSGSGTTQVLNGQDGVVNSAQARKLLAILALQKLRTKGGFANQMRVRILCRARASARCEGTVKLRSTSPLLTKYKGKKVLRRITFGSGAYQLARGRRGYAKALLTPAYSKFLLKRKHVKVDALITVLDETGHQQTLLRHFTLRASNK